MATQTVSPLDLATQLARLAGGGNRDVARFLTDGAYADISPHARTTIDRLLRGTQYEDRPGVFYLEWQQANQQQADQNRAAGVSNTREIRTNEPRSFGPPAQAATPTAAPVGVVSAQSPGAQNPASLGPVRSGDPNARFAVNDPSNPNNPNIGGGAVYNPGGTAANGRSASATGSTATGTTGGGQGATQARTPVSGYNGLGVAGQDLALRDPGTAYQAYRLANGMTNRSKSKYADFKASLVGQALSSLLNLETTQNPGVTKDNINAIIGRFSNAVNNNGMYGMLGGAAKNAAGRIDFGGMDDVDAEKMMKLIVGAQGLGQSPIGASALQSQLDDLLYQQGNQDISTDFESDPLGGKFKGSRLAQALAALGYR
ncbi:MAG TPA: hypothetical protein VIL85_19050 [Thermomicrobiales bacterium]|jgi:hypothetical protein